MTRTTGPLNTQQAVDLIKSSNSLIDASLDKNAEDLRDRVNTAIQSMILGGYQQGDPSGAVAAAVADTFRANESMFRAMVSEISAMEWMDDSAVDKFQDLY